MMCIFSSMCLIQAKMPRWIASSVGAVSLMHSDLPELNLLLPSLVSLKVDEMRQLRGESLVQDDPFYRPA
jgi:hypothetical protein